MNPFGIPYPIRPSSAQPAPSMGMSSKGLEDRSMNGMARAFANPPPPPPPAPIAAPAPLDSFASIWDGLDVLSGGVKSNGTTTSASASARDEPPPPSRLTQTKTGSAFAPTFTSQPSQPSYFSQPSYSAQPPLASQPSYLSQPSYTYPQPPLQQPATLLRPQQTGFVPSSQFGQQLLQEQGPPPPSRPPFVSSSSGSGSAFQPQPSPYPLPLHSTPYQPPFQHPQPAPIQGHPSYPLHQAQTNPFQSSMNPPAPQQQQQQNLNPFFGMQGTNFGGRYQTQHQQQQPLNPFGAQYTNGAQHQQHQYWG